MGKKHKLILIFLGVIIIGSSFFYNIEKTNAESKTDDEIQKLLRQPQPQIKIPGLSFSKPTVIDGNVENATIGEYIQTIYRFGIAIVSLVATIMIMIGGLQWILSAGSPEKITAAKKRVLQALLGIGLAVFSYTILYLINPSLVEFRSLTIKVIQEVDIDTFVKDRNTPPTQNTGTPKPFSDTTFDDIFKSFANCIGADYRVLKAFAFKESIGFQHTIVNDYGFIGLFQTKPENCRDALEKYPTWSAECNNLTNPHVNTAVGTIMLQKAFKKMDKCTEPLSAVDVGSLIYLNHNSGGGALNYILRNGGCEGGEKIKTATINFWNQHMGGIFNGKGLGEKRYRFSIETGKLIESSGVTNFRDTSKNGTASCPLEGSVPAYTETTEGAPIKPQKGLLRTSISCNQSFGGKKILALGSSTTAGPNSYAKFIAANCPQIGMEIIAKKGEQVPWMYEQIKDKDLSEYDYLILFGGTNDVNSNRSGSQILERHKKIYEKAKSDGVKIISLTLNPYGGYKTWNENKGNNLISFNNLLKAEQGNIVDYVIDWYTISRNPNNVHQMLPKYDSGDHLHSNKLGNETIAKTIVDRIFQ